MAAWALFARATALLNASVYRLGAALAGEAGEAGGVAVQKSMSGSGNDE